MTVKEAIETLGNVKVAVTTIRSGITHFKTLKEQYETEFEVLERELFIRKELKDFDVYQRQLEKLEKENQELKERYKHRAETSNDLCKAVKQYEKAFEILVEKIKTYLVELYSKEYFENNIKGKYSTLGIANRNGQEKALNMVLELLMEVLENATN